LIEELGQAGFAVESASDLVNTSAPYPEALPILLAHLERPYPDRIREGIARALAVRDAKFGWDSLTALYRREPAGTDTKDGLAVALAAASYEEVIGDVVDLARDERHGESRLLLLSALKRSKDPKARAALEQSGFGCRGVPSRPAPFCGVRRSPRGLCLHHRRADVLFVTRPVGAGSACGRAAAATVA